MEGRRKEKNEAATTWMSVPQFGDWDQKGGALPDYSMDFSKIREMRKQNKREPSRTSIGNENDLISSSSSSSTINDHHHHHHLNHSPTVAARRTSILRYFNCCVKAA